MWAGDVAGPEAVFVAQFASDGLDAVYVVPVVLAQARVVFEAVAVAVVGEDAAEAVVVGAWGHWIWADSAAASCVGVGDKHPGLELGQGRCSSVGNAIRGGICLGAYSAVCSRRVRQEQPRLPRRALRCNSCLLCME